MRHVDLLAIAKLIPKIETGTLTLIEANAFFILVRGSAPKSSIVRDIGDSVAHDERDRGLAHAHLNTIVDEFVAAIRDGGGIVSRTLYPTDELITELHALLNGLGLTLDIEATKRHQNELARTIGNMLYGTQIELNAPEFRAALTMNGDQPLCQFIALQNIGPLHAGQGIAMPMLRRLTD